MIEGRTILCFASGYDAPPTSKHHVMHLLAERNTVLWVNYHASRAPTASASDLRYMTRKVGQIFRGITNPRKNLYVLTPPVLPLPGSAWAKRINRRLLIARIRSALRRVGHGPVQVWSFTPDISYLLGHFDEEKVVYYCVDDHASFSGYDAEQVRRDEEELCRRADLVVTTSTALQEAKAPLNPNTILVPHGVDYEHFSKALRDDLPLPDDVKDIPHPILGFFGLIRDWVDLDLLAEVCRLRPDWHIVLLGDSTVDLAPYRGIPNMHFLGRRPYEQLPAYCKAFDVGLIPFRINELTRSVNPIKLREYLAAGLPVVSTPLPEVEAQSLWVHIAHGPGPMTQAVEAALARARDGHRNRHLAMREETWDRKVAAVADALEDPPSRHTASCPAGQPLTRGRVKVALCVSGGGYGFQAASLVRSCPPNVNLVVLATSYRYREYLRQGASQPSRYALYELPMQRQRGSPGMARAAARLAKAFVRSLLVLGRERPAAVISVADPVSIPLLCAARLLGMRTVFIESVTRVTKPSHTGRIVAAFGLADRLFVQWPEARQVYRGARYAGRLV